MSLKMIPESISGNKVCGGYMENIFMIDKSISADDEKHRVCMVYTMGSNFNSIFSRMRVPDGHELSDPIGDTELYSYLSDRQDSIDAVTFTGGEPAIHPEIMDIMRHIKGYYGMEIGLFTNGTNPDMLFEIICEGIAEYVTLDILSGRSKYDRASGVTVDDKLWKRICESCEMLIHEDEVTREFCTIAAGGFHTAEDFEEIRELVNGGDTYRLYRFGEGKAVHEMHDGEAHAQGLYMPSDNEMQEFAHILEPAVRRVIIDQ